MRAVVIGVTLSMFLACGGTSPTAPSPPVTPSIAGLWSGTYASAEIGFGTATMSVTQTGSNVSGTWSTRSSTGTTSAGTISGTVSVSRDVALRFNPSDPRTCPFQFAGITYSTQRRIDGQFVTVNCTVAASGTLILN